MYAPTSVWGLFTNANEVLTAAEARSRSFAAFQDISIRLCFKGSWSSTVTAAFWNHINRSLMESAAAVNSLCRNCCWDRSKWTGRSLKVAGARACIISFWLGARRPYAGQFQKCDYLFIVCVIQLHLPDGSITLLFGLGAI